MNDESRHCLCIPATPEDLPIKILDVNIVGNHVAGQFAVLFQQTLDFSTDASLALSRAETLLLYAWQELNTGKWSDVNFNWHKLYAAVSWLKAVATFRCRTTGESSTPPEVWLDIIKICDMGHLMGGDVWEGILLRTISAAEAKISELSPAVFAEPQRKKRTETVTICDVLHPIEELDRPSLAHFQAAFLRLKRPLMLKGILETWPALSKWSPEYVRSICGSRTVPVELGKRYTDEDWGQELMTISAFIDKYIYMLDNPDKKIAYLAQHDLLSQAPLLRDDISMPDYIAFAGDDDPDMNAWFGPEGTVSPLHHDPKDNFLCQVFGEKYVRLYEESESEKVYPHESTMLFNTSQVDVEDPDLERFPKFAEAVFSDCILRPEKLAG
ncbi:Lysine-specific demethylase 8 [Hypsibius exemplaris]|uniref:Lysine-specific demethylase 8 n=1 Tax=Hypsibius exemplaris TaxID=2072580 RepID=A0A1W0WVT7_HYPEX|nr:Lysine-specific demethylase 8 [Hypsibius exemplaris]